jgi:hypothetical protein
MNQIIDFIFICLNFITNLINRFQELLKNVKKNMGKFCFCVFNDDANLFE